MSRSVTRWGLGGEDARRWTLDVRLSCQRRAALVAESAPRGIHTATCGARTFQLGTAGTTEPGSCGILMLTGRTAHLLLPVSSCRGLCQCLQQRFGLLQVLRVKPFGEPAVDLGQYLPRFFLPALPLPQPA